MDSEVALTDEGTAKLRLLKWIGSSKKGLTQFPREVTEGNGTYAASWADQPETAERQAAPRIWRREHTRSHVGSRRQCLPGG